VDLDDRRNVEQALATEGAHHDLKPIYSDISTIKSAVTMIDGSAGMEDLHSKPHKLQSDDLSEIQDPEMRDKGHARDPMDEEPLFLGIGAGGDSLEPPQQEMVAESPTAAEFSIYDTAYQAEVDRIRQSQGRTATVYLNRRVDSNKDYKADENMVDAPKRSQVHGTHAGFKDLLDKAREKTVEPQGKDKVAGTSRTFSDIAAQAMENTRVMGKDISNRSGAAFDGLMDKMAEMKKERAERKDGPS
jgi:[calcium/calmodulin-dependent protein kinase] kinase